MLYQKITPKFLKGTNDEERALILYDPAEIYSRIKLKKYKRWQGIAFSTVFPNKQKGKCACGCGKKLTGRQTRWAEPKHAEFLNLIGKIINGDTQLIKRLMMCYLPYRCTKCNCEPYIIETKNTMMSGIHVDHIVAIKNGSGGVLVRELSILMSQVPFTKNSC